LIVSILKEQHVDWDYQIPRKLFHHFPLELLESVICLPSSIYSLATGGDFHLFWYGSILLQSDDLKHYYRERLQAFRSRSLKDISTEDIISAKVLRLDEEIKSLQAIGQDLIRSKHRFDRALGIHIIAANEERDARPIVSAMLTDKAEVVRGAAEDLIAVIKANQSIRTYWIKKLWYSYLSPRNENTISKDLLSRLENYRGFSKREWKTEEGSLNLERRKVLRKKPHHASHVADINNITPYISERELESLLAENPERIEEGLQLIKRQYDCPGIGRIDLLCKDKKGNLVIIELKKYEAKHESIMYQILSYKRYIERHVAKTNQKVRGVIIVGKIDERLRYAVEAVPDITVRTFNVRIE
jgi:hypothetical protein